MIGNVNDFDVFIIDDHDDKESQRILAELENIDDECDQKGIAFVKIDDDNVAREYGVDHLPSLVYFENKIPSLYHGDLSNEEQVLAWLVEQLASDTIEDITDEMLDKLIKKSSHLAVLFCKFNLVSNLERRYRRTELNSAVILALTHQIDGCAHRFFVVIPSPLIFSDSCGGCFCSSSKEMMTSRLGNVDIDFSVKRCSTFSVVLSGQRCMKQAGEFHWRPVREATLYRRPQVGDSGDSTYTEYIFRTTRDIHENFNVPTDMLLENSFRLFHSSDKIVVVSLDTIRF